MRASLPLVVALCSLLTAMPTFAEAPASADPSASPERAAKQRHKRLHTPASRISAQMERDLALSSEQAAKVREINQKSVESLQAITPTEEEIKQARRQQREILSEHDKQLKAVLSEKQYADYTAKKEKYQKRMRNMRPAEAH